VTLVPPAAQAADEPGLRSEKWYEQTLDGNKTGYIRVLWSPSTWEGKKSVHDTTTFVQATQRDMAGMKDRFETTTTIDLERGEDGTLWLERVRTEEAGRIQIRETRWTGSGYEYSESIVGQPQNKKTLTVALDAPVKVDAESFLWSRIQAGTLEVGQSLELPQLDMRGRRSRFVKLEVIGREEIEDETAKKIPCFKVRQHDPESNSEALLWIDGTGVLVRLRSGGRLLTRTTQAKAEAMPSRPAEYSITVGASPRLERIFNADRLLVDVYVRGDEHRKMPIFPKSPWSRMLAVKGDDKTGFVVTTELKRYDDETATARIPVVDKKFERWLEPTALMQTRDPLVLKTVREVVGEERDARKAAVKLARFVYTRLDKHSPKLGQAGAVQILKECRGDCSEHGLLFVTLCRAAGIPARACSGYVCIGSIWGGHAWAEIWTGQWIGADPTTGDVGTAARYLFFGYPEEPDSFPGLVSSRVRGRLRIRTTRIEEGDAAFDLTDENKHRIYDASGKRYLHVLAGLEAREVPDDWKVDLSRNNLMRITGPGFSATVRASADQGADIDSLGRYTPGRKTTFAGAPAMLHKMGAGSRETLLYLVFSRRRILQVAITGGDNDLVGRLEKVLAPTFQEPAREW